MRLSAITGVGIVLLGAVFYAGIGNLRGSLTEGTTGATVTITEDGHFSPETIGVTVGSTLTIENKNRDPQVMKVKTGRELFSSQVIFDTPFVFTIPSDANGTYTYFSETLPDDRLLTITVSAPIEGGANPPPQSEQAPAPADSAQIPLPFGDGPITPAENLPMPNPATPTPIASVTPTTPSIIEEQADGSEIISIGSGEQPAPANFDPSKIPTNPYVVGSDQHYENSAALEEKKLHHGAPLLEMRKHRPKVSASTGPDVWVALLLPALAGVYVFYRKIIAC